MKILVAGSAGQLGTAISDRFAARADVIRATRADVDLAATLAVEQFVADHAPDVLINCAAYNNVDGAEDRPVDALTVNAIAVRALARGAASCGATFVHYGTDFVFDGLADRPYVEEDEPSPQSVYASSKLLGEWFASEVPRHYVLRVESLFGGSARRSSVDRIVDAIKNGEPSRVFIDRTVTASFVNDVADATWHLLATNRAAGLYHCVNSGVTTWHDLAQEIAGILAVDAQLLPVKVADVPMKAKRPQYAALSNAKLARAGFEMPSWQNALRRYLTGT